MNNIKIDTQNLKEKLKKSEQTGIIAWEIGQIAERIKQNESFKQVQSKNYKYFSDYSTGELGKDEQTINIYIDIYKAFPEVDDVEKMLVSHLKELLRIRDDKTRKIALRAFEKLNETYLYSQDKIPVNRQFTTTDISEVVNLIKDSKDLSVNEIDKVIGEVIRLRDERIANKKIKKRDKFGATFSKPPFCSKLINYIEKEPIDEQGFVGLFCLAFDCIKEIEFDIFIDNNREKVKFDKIRFVREAFPDACLSVRNTKNQYKDFYVEFEFLTSNYFLHKHHLSDENCDMIVAWDDNLRIENYPIKQLEKLPPIFLVKRFLKEGITQLYEPKKSKK